MYSKPNWSVSKWGSQILDGDGKVILTAPDFISSDDNKFVKANIALASFAPELFAAMNALVDRNSIFYDVDKKEIASLLEKIKTSL